MGIFAEIAGWWWQRGRVADLKREVARLGNQLERQRVATTLNRNTLGNVSGANDGLVERIKELKALLREHGIPVPANEIRRSVPVAGKIDAVAGPQNGLRLSGTRMFHD